MPACWASRLIYIILSNIQKLPFKYYICLTLSKFTSIHVSLINFYTTVCVCVSVHGCVHAFVCRYTWRLDVNFRYHFVSAMDFILLRHNFSIDWKLNIRLSCLSRRSQESTTYLSSTRVISIYIRPSFLNGF